MSTWEDNELERRTAARVAGMGFIPAVNVTHRETDSEFDVYAFLPQEDGFDRLMVQCTTASPSPDKVRALKTCAQDFGANHWVFITTRKPHESQLQMAEFHDIEWLSESERADNHSATIAGRKLDVRAPLSAREKAISRFLRGISWLRRVAYEDREESCEAESVVQTWNALDQIFLIPDAFERLQNLYDIHNSRPRLSQACAARENLGPDPETALWNAMVYGVGRYTQSALAAQTTNRVFTLVTFAECACRVAAGDTIPAYLDDPRGRRGPLIRALAERSARHAFATAAFDFIYAWGGLWSASGISIASALAELCGTTLTSIRDARGRIETLLRDAGMEKVIEDFDKDYGKWECMKLLPYFTKGIGVRRFREEGMAALDGWLWDGWANESIKFEEECKNWEGQR